MRQYFAQREEEKQEMRRLVEATMAGHQSTKEAKRKLQAMKHKIGTGSSALCELICILYALVCSSASVQREEGVNETSP